MNSTESLCGICFQDEGNDPKAHTCNVLCGACGQFFGEEEMDSEGHHNADECEEARFSCGSCGYQFSKNEGVTIEEGRHLEFVCSECFGGNN